MVFLLICKTFKLARRSNLSFSSE